MPEYITEPEQIWDHVPRKCPNCDANRQYMTPIINLELRAYYEVVEVSTRRKLNLSDVCEFYLDGYTCEKCGLHEIFDRDFATSDGRSITIIGWADSILLQSMKDFFRMP